MCYPRGTAARAETLDFIRVELDRSPIPSGRMAANTYRGWSARRPRTDRTSGAFFGRNVAEPTHPADSALVSEREGDTRG